MYEIPCLFHGTQFPETGGPEPTELCRLRRVGAPTGGSVPGSANHRFIEGQIVHHYDIGGAESVGQFQQGFGGGCAVAGFDFGDSVDFSGPGVPGNGGIQPNPDIFFRSLFEVLALHCMDRPAEL